MPKYFIKLENNTYLPKNSPGHGFNGYLTTMLNDPSWAAQDTDVAAITHELGVINGQNASGPALASLINRDINGPEASRDQNLGLYGMAFHATPETKRRGPAWYIKSTIDAKFPLTLKLNSLVTKVLMSGGSKPSACGVEVMHGDHIYSASPLTHGSKGAKMARYQAKKEVIVAGGVFNTPQLLKLSGIGPAAELKSFNIPVVKDLPGVGENMADNYETSVIALANKDLTGGGPLIALLLKTPNSPGKNRNIYAFCGLFSFEGFWPGMPTRYGPKEYECAIVHMMPKSQAGYVKLRSADPTDMPEINFRYYQKGGDADLQELTDAAKAIRGALAKAGADKPALLPWNELHPCPGVNKTCTDAQQKEFIKLQSYSHHATSTCAIGADSDKMAVLDSQFRVRGVKNLRVVDASAFPRIPGAFPVLPTMMLAEKATEDILADA